MIKNTEIYKGMKKIDDDLGGTTPLNVILKFPKNEREDKEGDDEFDEWDKKIMMRISQNIGLQEIKWIKF